MTTKKMIYMAVMIVLFVFAVVVFGYLLLNRYKVDLGSKSGDGILSRLIDNDKEYLILYAKSNNVITSQSSSDQDCKNFNLYEYLGGGIVNRDGSGNKSLKIKDYPIGGPTSKKYNEYYYISSEENPVEDLSGAPMFNWNLDDQTLWSADYNNMEPEKITTSSGNRFPGRVISSPDNKYLVYLMTEKKENGLLSQIANEELTDSTLVVRNVENGEEKVVLQGNYNRQLFDSFHEFSRKEDAFFTIAVKDDGYRFVKVKLDTGEIKYFDEVYAPFNWENINWEDLFEGSIAGYSAYFHLSPNEDKLLAYKNYSASNTENYCYPSVSHKIWSYDIKGNVIDIVDEGSGLITDLSWKNDGEEYEFAAVSGGGCYPEYLNSSVIKTDKNGKNREILITEEKSKITNLSWSPDDKEIVYDVYGDDYVSYIKSLDPKTKEEKNIISTNETEGSINTDKPVTLQLVDWVNAE